MIRIESHLLHHNSVEVEPLYIFRGVALPNQDLS